MASTGVDVIDADDDEVGHDGGDGLRAHHASGNNDLILYLFGTPGQERFHFMWDELVQGAIGAVVLVDTGRLADSFASRRLLRAARAAVRRRGELASTVSSPTRSRQSVPLSPSARPSRCSMSTPGCVTTPVTRC